MNYDSQNPASERSTARADAAAGEGFPGQGGLGSFLLFSGAAIGILAFIDRTAGLPFEMPRTWYSTPELWYFFGFASFLSGVWLLRSVRVDNRRWQPEVPGRRFDRVVIYTRRECHLCDQAKDRLLSYRAWLPEIEQVDISKSPELIEQFGEEIPVVEIDGRVRFRGRVNEVLLRRLIEATPPRDT
jgi:glutaredoxin